MTELHDVWWADFHDETTGKTVRVHTHSPLAVGETGDGLLLQWGPDGVFRLEEIAEPAG